MDNNELEDLKAQYEQQQPPKRSKKGLFIIGGILVIFVSAAIVVSILWLYRGTGHNTVSPSSAQTTGPNPRTVIDAIATSSTVEQSKDYVLFRTGSDASDINPDTSTLIYKDSDYSFLTNTTPLDGLKFTLNKDGTSDKAALTTAIQQALTDASYKVTDQNTSDLSAYKSTTFTNGDTVCQLVDYAGAQLSGLEQSILCADGKTVKASYDNVASLLKKADANLITSAKAVSQANVTSGAKKLTTLTVQLVGSKETTSYYFATLDKDYTYLGKRATPSVDNEASYTLSDELKKNISDPKWGSFLTDNIK